MSVQHRKIVGQERGDSLLRSEVGHRSLCRFRHDVQLGIDPCGNQLVGQRIRIVWLNQEAVCFVSDQLLETRPFRSDYDSAEAHRFETTVRQVVDQRGQYNQTRSLDNGIELRVWQVFQQDQSIGERATMRSRIRGHRYSELRLHVSADTYRVCIRIALKKSRQRLDQRVKSFVQLKAAEVKHVLFVTKKPLPKVLEVAGRMVELYREITAKAL